MQVRIPDFAELVDGAFHQIRLYGRENPAVMVRLLEAIHLVAEDGRGADLRAALLRQARMIHQTAEDCIRHDWEREQIGQRFVAVRALLEP